MAAMAALLSTITVASVGLTCKAFLNSGLCSVQTNRLNILIHALESSARNGTGVVTVSNHISTLDDPLTWGVLPASFYFHSHKTRWTLGASEIMFTNPLFSTFFRLGQTIETFRGQGIYQKAVDSAIHKLDNGKWVHLFCEGKVNQPIKYSLSSAGEALLPRFKWGVGRIIMESSRLPLVVPMWLTGFDRLMPEGRPFLHKYIPRVGTQLGVAFGNPIPPEELKKTIAREMDEREARIRVTSLVHDHVEQLGRSLHNSSHTL